MDQKIDRFDGNISQGKSSEGSGPVSQSAVVNTSGRGLRRPGGKPMLTERQKRVLEYINESIQTRGYPPTLREIGEQMAIRSTNGVNDHLRALEKKGYL